MYCRTIFFLVNDRTLPSDNSLRFRKSLLKQLHNKSGQLMLKLEIKKIQYAINKEAAKNQPYHQPKLINMSILLVKKYYHLIKNK